MSKKESDDGRLEKIVPVIAVCITVGMISIVGIDYFNEKYKSPSLETCNNIIDFMGEKDHARFHMEYMDMMNELHLIIADCHSFNVFKDEDPNKMIGMNIP